MLLDQIREVNEKRQKLFGNMKELRNTFKRNGDRWLGDEQKLEWDRLNLEYERTTREHDDLMSRSVNTDHGIPTHIDTGRIDARTGEFIPFADRRGSRLKGPAADDADLVVAAWYRSQAGFPVTPEEFEACERFGVHPASGGIVIPLGAQSPAIGRHVRFGGRGEARALGRDPGADGGYTVPTGFRAALEVALKAHGPMIATSDLWLSSTGEDASWPTIDDTSNEGSQLGENTAASEDSMTFGSKVFSPYKYSSDMIRVSHELLRDNAVRLAEQIAAALGMRLGRIINRKATLGTGTDEPEGIVVGSTVGVTCASATEIEFDELIELVHSVDPAYRVGPGVGWMMNDSTASYVRRLKDNDGRYIWQPNQQVGQLPMLLGHPVFTNQHMANIAADAKPIIFGDLSKYKLRIVAEGINGLRLRRLTERYAEYDQEGFIGFMEADGKLLKASTDATLCPVRHLALDDGV